MGGNGTAIGVFFLYDEMMIYWGVGNINNYNSLWLLVYKKLRIIQSYSQPFLKASTNSHRLRNSLVHQKTVD